VSAAQEVHEDDCAAEYFPTEQLMQLTKFENRPTEQAAQLVDPESAA